MNDKVVKVKTDKKKLFFIIQIIAVSIMLVIGGVSLFIKNLLPFFYLALSINMIVLTVNNFLFLKKPYMWLVYLAFAIYTFILFIKGIM